MGEDRRRLGERLVVTGLGAAVVAVIGWLGTVLGSSWVAQPDVVEDLTAAWSLTGVQPLGATAAVPVPAGQTLVALLVGTDLRSIAGTTTGTCKATVAGEPLTLGWPVLLDFSVTGLLTGDREAVAIAGWTDTGAAATVDISCDTRDSTVDGFIAVPSATAVIAHYPWFQPWAWVMLGAAGAGLTAVGVYRLPRG